MFLKVYDKADQTHYNEIAQNKIVIPHKGVITQLITQNKVIKQNKKRYN
jgi:hypothetical protein